MKTKQAERYRADLEKCARCGSCKALCPTFDQDLLEGMGARGRITLLRKLREGGLSPSKLLNERIFSCILCGACEGTCPLGVDITGSIYRGRALLRETDRKRRLLRGLVRFSSRWPDLAFRIARTGSHVLLPLLAKRGIIPCAPGLPEVPLRRSDQVFRVGKKRGRVAVFTGCSVNYVFPYLGESLIRVLQKLRYEVILPKGEVCCGTPLRSLGLEGEAAELAKKNLRAFDRLKVEAILSICPTCTYTIRDEYPKMIGDGLERATDISVFFRDKLDTARSIGKTVAYHDPCHLRYGLGITEEPREIIKKAGIHVREPEDQGCCGFGGLFCFSFREMSDRILEKRSAKIIDTEADAVVTSCPGCMLQLGRNITDRPVLHLVELIEEAYCDRSEEKAEKSVKDREREPTLF
jgi:glycolate oxidase iron-sulfur subunit